MEDTISNLRQSLKLSQTRLYNRSQKPIQEIFFDEAQQGYGKNLKENNFFQLNTSKQ